MAICKSSEVPEISKHNNLPRDIHRIYIEHTKGIWLRHNEEDQTIEIWHDGQFQASWSDRTLGNVATPKEDVFVTYINANTVSAMLDMMIEVGKRLRSKEIAKLIGKGE